MILGCQCKDQHCTVQLQTSGMSFSSSSPTSAAFLRVNAAVIFELLSSNCIETAAPSRHVSPPPVPWPRTSSQAAGWYFVLAAAQTWSLETSIRSLDCFWERHHGIMVCFPVQKVYKSQRSGPNAQHKVLSQAGRWSDFLHDTSIVFFLG